MTDDVIFVKSDVWPRRDGKADWTLRVPVWDAITVGVADDVPGAYEAIADQLRTWAEEQESAVSSEATIIRVNFDAVEEA